MTEKCIFCDGEIVEVIKDQQFQYGAAPDTVILTAKDVPIMECQGCDEAYTDWRGEDARHFTALAHIGGIDGTEVVRTRIRSKMSETEFAAWLGVTPSVLKSIEDDEVFATREMYVKLRELGDYD